MTFGHRVSARVRASLVGAWMVAGLEATAFAQIPSVPPVAPSAQELPTSAEPPAPAAPALPAAELPAQSTPKPSPLYIYTSPETADEPPETLPYQKGQRVPRGYRVERTVNSGLLIPGAVGLGLSYALAGLIAESEKSSKSSGWLAIPLVGPFIAAAARKRCRGDDFDESCDGYGIGGELIVDGLLQGVGATLLITGLLVPHVRLVRADVASFEVMPMLGRGQAGLAASGSF